MLIRVFGLAAGLSLFGWLIPAQAVENLEAGKSPSQIFAGTCNACHKSPRGLLKTVAPSALPGFLRQHYTTSSDMAGVLASYLVSNGATDTRYQNTATQQPKGMKDAPREREGGRESATRDRQEARSPATEPSERPSSRQNSAALRDGADSRQSARSSDPDGAQPTGERSDGRKNAKQRLSKRGKPSEDLPRPDAPATEAPKVEAKPEPKPELKPDLAKGDAGRSEPGPAETARPETRPAPARPDTAPPRV